MDENWVIVRSTCWKTGHPIITLKLRHDGPHGWATVAEEHCRGEIMVKEMRRSFEERVKRFKQFHEKDGVEPV